MPLADRFYKLDLYRQMLGVKRHNPFQFLEQRRRDALGFAVPHPMHDPVSYGYNG